MELSSPRFKALAVSAGFSFWFLIIISALGFFSIKAFVIFIIIVFPLMQLLSLKVSRVLDIFAIYLTNLFLGILFVAVFSLYGIFFRILRIDLLRLQKQKETYWLVMEQLKQERIFKGY